MRAVVQRVKKADVRVDDRMVGEIGQGLLVLLGVGQEDAEADADYLADKIAGLRIFADDQDKMNLSVTDVDGDVMAEHLGTAIGTAGMEPGFFVLGRLFHHAEHFTTGGLINLNISAGVADGFEQADKAHAVDFRSKCRLVPGSGDK